MSTVSLLERRAHFPSEANGRTANHVLADDQHLYEIVHGERVESPMSAFGGWLKSHLFGFVAPFVNEHRLGTAVCETVFIVDAAENEQRRPDLAFVLASTWPLDRPVPKVGEWKIVPDLAVEVISPNDLFEKVFAKVAEYFSFGVKQVWVISPIAEMIYVYDSPRQIRALGLEDELDGGSLLPGFRLKIADLFGATSQT